MNIENAILLYPKFLSMLHFNWPFYCTEYDFGFVLVGFFFGGGVGLGGCVVLLFFSQTVPLERTCRY